MQIKLIFELFVKNSEDWTQSKLEKKFVVPAKSTHVKLILELFVEDNVGQTHFKRTLTEKKNIKNLLHACARPTLMHGLDRC